MRRNVQGLQGEHGKRLRVDVEDRGSKHANESNEWICFAKRREKVRL